MSMTFGFGIYNTYNKMLKSVSGYEKAIEYIKTLKNKEYEEVWYLFKETPVKVRITKTIYIQRYTESGGGVEQWGPKYYFNLKKFFE